MKLTSKTLKILGLISISFALIIIGYTIYNEWGKDKDTGSSPIVMIFSVAGILLLVMSREMKKKES